MMPLDKKWSKYNKKNVSEISNFLGVYELGVKDVDIHYIGEGKVRDRLMEHFSDGSSPTPGCSHFRVEFTGTKETAGQRERAELKKYYKQHGRLPKYNDKIG